MTQQFGEPIARGFRCLTCGNFLEEDQRVVDTKSGAIHKECYEVTLVIVQTQKKRQSLHVPEHLDELDTDVLETYMAVAGAAIQKVLELNAT